MLKNLRLVLALAPLIFTASSASADGGPGGASSGGAAPLKVLLVIGGCCHDYSAQSKLLKDGIEERIRAVVDVATSDTSGTKAKFDIYESDDWADGYDVIIHDECSADVTSKPYVDRILAAHRGGVPAVNLHCAMHSYRWGDYRQPVEASADNAGWYDMLGLQSSAHGAKTPIDVIYSDTDHPITTGLANWTTTDEELYNNLRVFSGASVLAKGDQMSSPKAKKAKAVEAASPQKSTAVVAWTNHYGEKKTPIFSTSLGHQNETVADARYLDLVVRGLLWTTGNLDDGGKATARYAK